MSAFAPARENETRIVARRSEIDPGTDYVAPNGAMETHLAAILESVLNVDQVGRKDSFFELGGGSLQAIDLLMRVEKELGVVLPPSTIIDHPTLEQFAALLTGNTRPYTERCVIPLQPEGVEPPLFLLHELGGNLFCYGELVRRLGTRRKLFGIQYPGQDQDPIPQFSIPQMANIYVDAIKQVQPEGPYLLAGFSFGGTVAYEIACQLRGRGDRVALLVLIDAGNRDGLVRGVQRLALKLSQHLAILSEQEPSIWVRLFLYAVCKEFRSKKTAAPIHAIEPPLPVPLPEKIRHLMYETLLRAHAEYAAPVFDGPIKLFRTNGRGTRWSRRHYGWRDRALGGVEVIDVHGDHGSVLGVPNVGLVAEYLNIWISQALNERTANERP
jgi:thioesterase domain-containing protein/acyl carrier protein